MKKIQKFNRIVGLVVVIGLLSPSLPMHAYNRDYTVEIANEALKAYNSVGEEGQVEEVKVPETLPDMLKAFVKPYAATFVAPSERAMLQRAFEQLALPDLPLDQSVIDEGTVKELELLRGGNRSEDTLINRLTQFNGDSLLSTVVGRKSMIEAITMPIDDLEQVTNRQRVIKLLTEKDFLRKRCFALLQKMKEAEPYLFEIYARNGITKGEEAVYPSPFMRMIGLGEVPSAITLGNRLFALLVPYAAAAAGITGGLTQHPGMPPALKPQFVAFSLIEAVSVPLIAGQVKSITHIIKNMQDRLIHVATFMRSAQALMQLLAGQKDVVRFMPQLDEALELVQSGPQASKKFNYLNKLLQKSAFDEGAPSALSSPGNVLVAYKYMVDKAIRGEYEPFMRVVGELDSYVALAQKIVAHKDQPAKFCFAGFEQNKDQPMIKATNFWNPFIDQKVVVPNTVSLGTGAERNIILSGPNTGGKSTVMKALMMSVLMAQAYGVAPAEDLKITPFSKLITYLNITDDTGAGVSLFKAEVQRASELMNMLKALPENQFAFVMIDEIFTGTSPDKAEQLSYQFMNKLSEFKNVIFINATHFKKLNVLEQETGGQVKNYHTGVITDDAGRVVKYTYKLVPGPTTVSSAQQVAEESGIEF